MKKKNSNFSHTTWKRNFRVDINDCWLINWLELFLIFIRQKARKWEEEIIMSFCTTATVIMRREEKNHHWLIKGRRKLIKMLRGKWEWCLLSITKVLIDFDIKIQWGLIIFVINVKLFLIQISFQLSQQQLILKVIIVRNKRKCNIKTIQIIFNNSQIMLWIFC